MSFSDRSWNARFSEAERPTLDWSNRLVAQRQYRAWRKALWREWVSEYKCSRGCIDCGYNESAVALDFDHVRGEKLFNLGGGDGNPYLSETERIDDEIAKCVIRCANCHRVRSFGVAA